MTHPLLSAPHILYAVFLHLPQHDLLLIKRVCRAWREVITSSRVLQAALFLEPAADAARDDSPNDSVRLNPLLLSRFPAFFDIKESRVSRDVESIWDYTGPYYTTHWAASIRPWGQFVQYGGDDICTLGMSSEELALLPPEEPDTLVGAPERLDPDRTAAYRRPEASWRRMLPCMPPPVELQIWYEPEAKRPRAGILRCLRFDKADGRRDGTRGDYERRWLTFGLIYDLIEAAWFRNQPSPISTLQCDWTFQDIRPRLPPLNFANGFPSRTREEWDLLQLYGKQEKLREGLPNKTIGGPGRVLILSSTFNEQEEIDARKRFRADLELGLIDGNAFEWDEEIPYEFP